MAPPIKGKRKQSEEGDPLHPPVSPQPDGEQSRSQSPVQLEDSPEAGREREEAQEREEEQAFLVSLYKFMKERHTPIERVPHLGFKQINLWKIYKAVEKLGAYELVTGRRLWKNVYDELGGSPGSTSAATCTRRHYERLVLPYVRHLKGEDDKPLPPSKPRKQYKMAKEPRGDDRATERPKKAKEEKQVDQMMPRKTKTDTPDLARLPSQESSRDSTEQPGQAPGPSLPSVGASGCPEAYRRLLSNFYCKGTHGIMSPLAKKKLLAQVSKVEALQCQEEGCHHGAGGPNREPPVSPAVQPLESPRSPGGLAENSRHQLTPQEGTQAPGGSLGEEAQAGPRPSAPIFTGCFHAYPTEVLKPVSQHPRDFFPSLKDGVLLGPLGKEEGLPAKEPQLVWGGDADRPSAFHKGGSQKGSLYPKPKACWVSPMAKVPAESPVPLPTFTSSPGLGNKRSLEEEGLAHGGKKLRAVSPFLKEVDAKECGAKSLGPGLAVSCLLGPALGPALPEAYRGTMLRCPLNFAGTPDPLKGQATLPFSPLVIPAFPAHLLATTAPSPMAAGLMHFPPASFDSALRHRLCPASSPWHVPPATTYAAPHFSFHLNTKL
ncbi:AT-rich interactive domain-containing protein 5A [Camelus dromedarius]|uniref:AT-rich interactive domain-containing protein 5A n=1 Tax=Camelus dromedarius TaxID=9838 RepID=A0A5N4CCT4_CAMDR|nr:AT-rich interactive domain-containing protein 5A isoform X1 [Camelus dromedarius]KAB1256677.1 AT-rich interactive domain-containing protein 5A [Camelus dromedarius]